MIVDESVRNADSRRPLQGNSFNFVPEMPEKRYVFFNSSTGYECKAVAQERPYVSRPSRTQQLLNPKLLPKLTSDVPQDLLRKKGVADEQLAKIEQEKGRKRNRPEEGIGSTVDLNSSPSTTSSSSASVATISTNASRSPRTGLEAQFHSDRHLSTSKAHMDIPGRKRRRSVSSDDSYPSEIESNRGRPDGASTRSTRRKIGEHSPVTRGRRRSRADSRSRHTSYSSSGRSLQRYRLGRGSDERSRLEVDNAKSPYRTGVDSVLRRRDSTDPNTRRRGPRDSSSSPSRKSRRKRSSSPQVEKNQRKAVNSNSMKRPRDRSFSSDGLGRQRYSDVDERYGTSVKVSERVPGRAPPDRKSFRGPPRERSLSPFSKRLALTQAMNAGR